MPLIYMETEQVRNTGQLVWQFVTHLDDAADGLSSAWHVLQDSWEGGHSKEQFGDEISRLLQALRVAAEEGSDLAHRIQLEVDEWEKVDRLGVSHLSKVVSIGTQTVVPLVVGPLSAQTILEPLKNFEVLGNGVLELADLLTYKDYRNIGRALNELSGNMKAGWVGEMDGLGHLLRSKVAETGMDFFSAGLNIGENLLDGDSVERAIGTGLIEFAIEEGVEKLIVHGVGVAISAVAVGAPTAGVGTLVYLAYEAELIRWRGIASGLDQLGMDEAATTINSVVDTVDIDTYLQPISEKISDAIYDFGEHYYNNPDQIVPDLQNTANTVNRYATGMVDGIEVMLGRETHFWDDL